MKTNLASALRTTALAATLFVLPAFASANDAASTDNAARLLALSGSVSVKNAGPYVEAGTFRIQVATKLGHPAVALADGTWLYANRTIEGSEAQGTLVVRFDAQGRVSSLSIVTPAVATALAAPKKIPGTLLVAGRQ